VNHFWTLTHEVRVHLHIPPTDLTRISIQTTLTRRSIRAEIRRKKKNEEKENVKKNAVIRGVRAWRHLPEDNPITVLNG
jgi:hypothetical protein